MAELQASVQRHSSGMPASVQIAYDVLTGPLTDQLLAHAAEKQIDLLFLGHRLDPPGRKPLARRLAMKADLELLARLARADCRGRTGNFDCGARDWFIERARTLGVKPPAPLLLGRHVLALGVPAGPRVGELLKTVYDRQLDGEITTVDDAIAAARSYVAAHLGED